MCFGLEYAARLWTADLVHPDASPARARMRYALSPMGIIDLLAFAPGLLVLFVPVSSPMLNAARIVRLVRLIKLSRYMRGLRSIACVFRKRRPEIVAAFMVLALLTVTASVLMYEIEHPVQPEKFDSVFTGMYLSLIHISHLREDGRQRQSRFAGKGVIGHLAPTGARGTAALGVPYVGRNGAATAGRCAHGAEGTCELSG